jgi:titin
MRLNSDGMQDLVILRRGHTAPMVIRTEAGKFTVGNTADGGEGSLRQAILDANASGQSANIIFSVPGTGAPVIRPSGTLPTATVPVTIDGTTQQPAGFVVLDGGSAGAGANGFVLGGGNSLIKGLVIGHFSAAFDSQGGITGGFGAFLTGSGNHTIEDCNIGVDSTGEVAQGSGLGIAITSNNNTIGGTAQGTGNLISGNTVDGIVVGTRSNNVIAGNFIGTDVRGVSALPNGSARTGGDGVFLNDSINTTIAGNLISGNLDFGVEVGGSGNVLNGNFIGADASGLQAIENGTGGVLVFSANNGVGGTSASAPNLISGNPLVNVTIGLQNTSGITGNLVQGNFIGTNKLGNAPLGNSLGGVLVEASNNTVGGAVAGSGNLISGASSGGTNLDIKGDGTFGGNQLMGNRIGTDISGTIALGSTDFGVFIDQSPNNTVGGAQPATGNLISGHTADGLVLYQAASTGNMVQGNFIGTDITGKTAVPNKGFGVGVTFAPGNTVTSNLVSGNSFGGVGIGNVIKGEFGDSSTLLKGNFIGVDATLAAPLANTGDGVFVENDSINNQIVGNQIGFNQGAGIRIPDAPSNPSITPKPAVQIKMSSNQIYSNSGLGIDLGPLGPTPNPGNLQTGANRHQNFPTVATAMVSAAAGGLAPAAATITVAGTMSASANTTYGLEFFLGGSCESGQGHESIGTIPVLLGSGNVSTDGTGNASYTFTFPVPSTTTVSNGFVNATATDPVGNTSEFSLCAPVSGTIPAGPSISSVQGAGKNLLVMGQNFDSGAIILKNGNPQRTLHDDQNPTTTLVGKKVNKNIAPGETVTIQVQNSDGSLSNQVSYTR